MRKANLVDAAAHSVRDHAVKANDSSSVPSIHRTPMIAASEAPT